MLQFVVKFDKTRKDEEDDEVTMSLLGTGKEIFCSKFTDALYRGSH